MPDLFLDRFQQSHQTRALSPSDHRNGSSLTRWFTETYIGGAEYGLGNPHVDGCEQRTLSPPVLLGFLFVTSLVVGV